MRTFWSIQNNDEAVDVNPYGDNVGAWYHYTSNVQNHKQIVAGDVVLVRTRDHLVGTGVIYQVERLVPRSEDDAKLVHFRAHYDLTWHEFDELLPLDLIRDAWNPKHRQMSIRRLDAGKILSLIQQHGSRSQLLSISEAASGNPTVATQAAGRSSIEGGYEEVLTKVRRGQAEFRAALLARHGDNCAVTGPCPRGALEAAHLIPFSVDSRHDLTNGLLLRADIHRLFDKWDLGVDTSQRPWKVVLSPKLRNHPAVSSLHLRPLAITEDDYPNQVALAQQLDECTARWAHDV